ARELATTLAVAHALGLAHGRLGPTALCGTATNQPRLDFTATDVHGDEGVLAELDAVCRAPEAGRDVLPPLAADMYSLGMLLSWLLTGTPPPAPRHGPTDERASTADATSPLDRLVRSLLVAEP